MNECLHLRYNYWGQKGCDLLTTMQDCKKCPFYCDGQKYEYSHIIYQGAKCIYIKEKGATK